LTFTQKANLLRQLHRLLKKRYGAREFHKPIHPVEHAVAAILWEQATSEQVEAAMNRLRRAFVDWNEVRVSRPREIREVLGSLPRAASKAEQIPLILHEVFMQHHSMCWSEFLEKMGKRQMREFFEKIPGLRHYVAATIARDFAGAHAFPIDLDLHRVLVRLGILAPEISEPEAQAFMERAVKNAHTYELHALLKHLAETLCKSNRPKCSRCPLRAKCPSMVVEKKRKRKAPAKARKVVKKKTAKKAVKKAAKKKPAPKRKVKKKTSRKKKK
ncbi:MAG: hypothetical protein QF662_09130, partial [Phycisphaerae bacterium]|nr:hypothetical protein [Phycisphaerae bacterium]